MFQRYFAALLLIVVASLAGCQSPRAVKQGLWSGSHLYSPPSIQWGTRTGLVQELYYENEPLNGKPTRVFAYLGRPGNNQKSYPAMVLVHGGGGKAFKEWAEHWAKNGYVAIAMDLSGNGPAGRLPEGGPDQSDKTKFKHFSSAEAREMWTYHAVAAILRAHSLLRNLPEVDKSRIGITGISWGGYLTCIAAGVDNRFKVAVPVYGCGFLHENSVWKDGSLKGMTEEARNLWIQLFDPSQYVGNIRYPILFVNGTTDFAYPLDSYKKTYSLVPEKWRHISVAVNRPHGHIWTFPEVDAFVNSKLNGTAPLPRVGKPTVNGSFLSADVQGANNDLKTELAFTSDTGTWQKRKWQTIPAKFDGRQMTAELPSERPLVAFLTLKDHKGNHLSSEHIELP